MFFPKFDINQRASFGNQIALKINECPVARRFQNEFNVNGFSFSASVRSAQLIRER